MASVFTQAGEEYIVNLMDPGDGQAKPTQFYTGWGTGAGTAAKGDTTLFTEAPEARVTGTYSQPAADKFRVVATLTASAGRTITNAGYFTASSGGTLIVKGDFTGIVLATNDKIEFTIDLEYT